MRAIEQQVVNTIKGLAMDAVQAANSGHPGAPMGMADIATVLWGRFLKYDPTDARWPDRDRFVLSNGHASMLLYSMLFLTGTDLSLDDLKNFRQWGSPTAGHPEHGFAKGIETTTGPLGQGFANGVGMALAEAWLRARFGDALVDHYTYVFAGDGCLMEGVCAEAASLAGHLGLGRLIVLYDDNKITIDGSTDIAFTEDVTKRFEAYGWRVLGIDGHDREAVARAIDAAKAEGGRPTLIRCRTTIAHGAPTLAGTSKAHGSPLGKDEIKRTKELLGMDPDASFAVSDDVLAFFRGRDGDRIAARQAWEARLAAHPERDAFLRFLAAPDADAVKWPTFEPGTSVATRKASAAAIKAMAAGIENLVGGSADLAESNGSHIPGGGDVSRENYGARNINFGVREHGMAAICNGMALHGGVVPFCATFLAFYDYMRPSVRLAALMHQPVIFVYTHDSVFLGEDGPTHQPVEHLMAMRGVPNLYVVRPADGAETVEAWKLALKRRDGPTALCLTRQNLPNLDHAALGSAEGLHRGGYVLAEASGGKPAVVLIATGSEVPLALAARDALEGEGTPARVVSLPCWERLREQPAGYREALLPWGVPRVSIEAGITFGWEGLVGDRGASVGIDRFGASAPGEVVAEKLGLNVDNVVATARRALAG